MSAKPPLENDKREEGTDHDILAQCKLFESFAVTGWCKSGRSRLFG